jgi:hypothetical protein
MEPQYPSNSDKSREHTDYSNKHVTGPAVSGGARCREKNWLDQVREFFGIAECHTFRDYVSTLSDVTNRVYGAIDTLLGGRPANIQSQVPGARIAYANYYNQQTPKAQPSGQQKTFFAATYEDLEFDLRQDAEIVLLRMNELLQMYQAVSVGDLFDLAGVTSPNGYTDQKFGWTPGTISGARVVPFGRKYRIVGLPVPVQLR